MRKTVCIVLVLFVIAVFGACQPDPVTVSVTTATPSAGESVSATAEPTATPAESSTATAAESPTEVPTPSPTSSGPRMYTSYAILVSFDPATGIGEFDYFDMLRGEEAVAYLVAHEGYTEAEAQDIVDDFADSEYVPKNTNTQLRAIDLDDVSLNLMYQPDGTPMPGADSVPSTAGDFRAIYALDSGLLLNSFFYKVHVAEDGHVYWVEQVYWP